MKENLHPQTNLEKKEIEILKGIADSFKYEEYYETLDFSINHLVTWLFENDFTGSKMSSHYTHLVFLKDGFKELSKNIKEKETELLEWLKSYTNYDEMLETLDFTIDKLTPYFFLTNMCGGDLANDCQRLIHLKNTFKELVKLENQ